MKNKLIILSLFFLFDLNAQNIGKSKSELNSNKSSQSKSTRQTDRSSSSIQNSESNFFLYRLVGHITFGAIKYGIIGDYKNELHLKNNLTIHPFSINGRGNYSKADTLKTKNFRIDIENSFLKSGSGVFGNHLDLKIRPTKYIYFKTDYFELFDRNLFTNQVDRLSIMYFNVAYDRVRTEKFNLGWTLGLSYVGTGVNKAGFSYGLTTSYFLKHNTSISITTNSSIINQEPVNNFELKVNYYKKNFFGSLGYELLKIATPVYHFIGVGAGVHF